METNKCKNGLRINREHLCVEVRKPVDHCTKCIEKWDHFDANKENINYCVIILSKRRIELPLILNFVYTGLNKFSIDLGATSKNWKSRWK